MAGFPTFAPITFHLLASYSLMALSSAWLWDEGYCVSYFQSFPTRFSVTMPQLEGVTKEGGGESPYVIFRELGIMHILRWIGQPMLKEDVSTRRRSKTGLEPTLYQCFFTLPSVRWGKN